MRAFPKSTDNTVLWIKINIQQNYLSVISKHILLLAQSLYARYRLKQELMRKWSFAWYQLFCSIYIFSWSKKENKRKIQYIRQRLMAAGTYRIKIHPPIHPYKVKVLHLYSMITSWAQVSRDPHYSPLFIYSHNNKGTPTTVKHTLNSHTAHLHYTVWITQL